MQLGEALGVVGEAAHVQHQDARQAQQLDLLLGCHWHTLVCCLVVCINISFLFICIQDLTVWDVELDVTHQTSRPASTSCIHGTTIITASQRAGFDHSASCFHVNTIVTASQSAGFGPWPNDPDVILMSVWAATYAVSSVTLHSAAQVSSSV